MAKCKECEERRTALRDAIFQVKVVEAVKQAAIGAAELTGLKKKASAPVVEAAQSTVGLDDGGNVEPATLTAPTFDIEFEPVAEGGVSALKSKRRKRADD